MPLHHLPLILAITLLLPHLAQARQDPGQRRDAAVAGALQWLATHQLTEGPDAGSWPTPKPEYRPAVASLAGLAFLANGHTPQEGAYAEHVHRALRYVIASSSPEGYLGQGDRSGMYIHAISTLFGLSCLGMTGDPDLERQLAAWGRDAIQLIIQAQSVNRPPAARGGWRYTPYTNESDASVTTWQLLVLHAAAQCGYPIEPTVIDDAMRYLDAAHVQLAEGAAGYLYRPGISTRPEPAVTGAILSIRRLLRGTDAGDATPVLRYLDNYPPAWGGDQYANYFYFTAFYMTQGMFQVGGHRWTTYHASLSEVLLNHQTGDGSWPYPPDNMPQSRLAGPAYPVAMTTLMLSLERQYLPMYQRQQPLY